MKKLLCLLLMGLLITGCAKETEGPSQNVEENVSAIQETLPEAEKTASTQETQTEADVYTYEDMTITFPASWEGKYLIQDGQDGFAIMQKASYEKEEGMGFLFGFYKSAEMIDTSMGACQVAYTDDCLYYMQEVTDVSYWYEDEEIAKEYCEMLMQKETVVASLMIAGDNVRYNASEYILPMSELKEIPEGILENMPANDLWIAQNEIFARHGREFKNNYLNNYFTSCSWYEPSVRADDFDENVLSETENRNLEKIAAQREKLEEATLYPQSCQFGKEYFYDLDGDGKEEKFSLRYSAEDETEVWEVSMVLDGDMMLDLSSEEVYYFAPNTDEYYITDISPYFPGLEIAVMDYGMSDDLVTHFYTYDDGLHYIGTIGGFPFKKYMELDGCAQQGCVQGTMRTDLIHTCFSYANWYYDYENKELVLSQGDMYEMVPGGDYELKKDIELLRARDVTADKVTLKAQQVFFLETDGKEWIKLKGKDGTQGYIHITDGMMDGVGEAPQDIITGLYFAG